MIRLGVQSLAITLFQRRDFSAEGPIQSLDKCQIFPIILLNH